MTVDEVPRTIKALSTSFESGEGVRVGILDSGWDRRLKDPRVLPGLGFVDDRVGRRVAQSSDDNDRIGHGTACASIVLEIAPACRVVPLRVFEESLETSPELVVAAMHAAAEARIDILNVSLGTELLEYKELFDCQCEALANAGMLIVAAAHPKGLQACFPASLESVIAVGLEELEEFDEISFYADAFIECRVSSRGWTATVLGGRRRRLRGTSYAAPVVSGLLARWRSSGCCASVDAARAMLQRESRTRLGALV